MIVINRFYIYGIGLLLGCLVSLNSTAAMYKWVDADGNVQYTQTPPPEGFQSETIKPPPGVDSENARQYKLGDDEQGGKKAAGNGQQQGEAQEDPAVKKAKCEQAKARLASYERPRVNYVDPDGTRRRATEEERQAELKKSQDLINKLCN